MKKLTAIGIICATLMTISMPANAKGGGAFGERDEIHKIQDVDLPGSMGENLYLGYMTESYFVIAGVYMNDAGYVIGVEGDDDSYYEMPEGEELAALQAEGLLPSPLPAYKIPLLDYLIGYSLWIIIIGMVLWGMIFGSKDEDEVVVTSEDTQPTPSS